MTDPTVFGAQAAQNYAERPARQVPGFASLHRMTALLLDEVVPADARILVLGAGGGLELKALGDFAPGWCFDGVDPSPDMLSLAREITADHAPRMRFHEGYVDAAPEGPFDAAVCLLTFHFISRPQRLETLREISKRLRPGAPFVLAHISFSQSDPERLQWIDRHIAYAGGTPSESAREMIGTRLTILAPDEEEAMLREAGFTGVTLFYAGLSFRGWVSYAG